MQYKKAVVTRPIRVEALISAFSANRGKEYVFHGESHDFWEMVYVEEGTAGITADDRVLECGPGSLVFHKPNEFHRIWTVHDDCLRFTVISFVETGSFLLERLSNSAFAISPSQQSLLHKLQNILRATGGHPFLSPVFEQDPVILGQFTATLELLLYQCATEQKAAQTDHSPASRLFSRAVQQMRKNLSQPLKAQQLAEELQVSLSQLKRVFHQYAMVGIHSYHLAMKIDRAKQLLSRGEPVCLVAEQLGFFNQNYFSTVFKRETGVSPKQWTREAEG